MTRAQAAALAWLILDLSAAAQEVPTDPGAASKSEDRAQVEAQERRPDESTGREYCATLPGTTPRRLAPGQDGVCTIVLALQSKAVIQTTTEFRVAYAEHQEPVTLGAWLRRPAARSRLYARYRETPVYDNTVVIEVPIRIGAHASHGSYPIRFEITTQLHDGDAGEALAQYSEAVSCNVEVGPALPEPLASPSAAEPPVAPETSPAPGEATATPAAPPEAMGSELSPVVFTDLEMLPTTAAADGAAPAALLPGELDDASELWWLGAAAALVVALAALLLRRRG